LDGSGYPSRLRGAEIDPDAALVAVADVFEALTVARPYRTAWDLERVERYLRGLAGVQFDAAAVEALFRIGPRYDYWAEERAVRPRR
jgi:HD-GYP domain-containing protein (c-di-GMP phosphodiesterase class II)